MSVAHETVFGPPVSQAQKDVYVKQFERVNGAQARLRFPTIPKNVTDDSAFYEQEISTLKKLPSHSTAAGAAASADPPPHSSGKPTLTKALFTEKTKDAATTLINSYTAREIKEFAKSLGLADVNKNKPRLVSDVINAIYPAAPTPRPSLVARAAAAVASGLGLTGDSSGAGDDDEPPAPDAVEADSSALSGGSSSLGNEVAEAQQAVAALRAENARLEAELRTAESKILSEQDIQDKIVAAEAPILAQLADAKATLLTRNQLDEAVENAVAQATASMPTEDGIRARIETVAGPLRASVAQAKSAAVAQQRELAAAQARATAAEAQLVGLKATADAATARAAQADARLAALPATSGDSATLAALSAELAAAKTELAAARAKLATKTSGWFSRGAGETPKARPLEDSDHGSDSDGEESEKEEEDYKESTEAFTEATSKTTQSILRLLGNASSDAIQPERVIRLIPETERLKPEMKPLVATLVRAYRAHELVSVKAIHRYLM